MLKGFDTVPKRLWRFRVGSFGHFGITKSEKPVWPLRL